MDEEGKDSKNVQVEPTCFEAQSPTEAQVCEIREEEKEGKDIFRLDLPASEAQYVTVAQVQVIRVDPQEGLGMRNGQQRQKTKGKILNIWLNLPISEAQSVTVAQAQMLKDLSSRKEVGQENGRGRERF